MNEHDDSNEPRYNHPIMDEDDAERDEYRRGYREASEVGLVHIQSVLDRINCFRGSGHFACRCAMVAHGMWKFLTEKDQVEIAQFFRCERANVNKMVKLIQKRLGLPPTLGQRSERGCEQMSQRRVSQLKHYPQHRRD